MDVTIVARTRDGHTVRMEVPGLRPRQGEREHGVTVDRYSDGPHGPRTLGLRIVGEPGPDVEWTVEITDPATVGPDRGESDSST